MLKDLRGKRFIVKQNRIELPDVEYFSSFEVQVLPGKVIVREPGDFRTIKNHLHTFGNFKTACIWIEDHD